MPPDTRTFYTFSLPTQQFVPERGTSEEMCNFRLFRCVILLFSVHLVLFFAAPIESPRKFIFIF